MIDPKLITSFVNYCYDWYGKGGIYDHDASRSQVKEAVMYYLYNPDRYLEFQGDSMDREQVREVLESKFGLSEIAYTMH